MENATYLFEKPSRQFKNSESTWTAVAKIALIYISKNMQGTMLPIYKSDNEGYLTKNGDLSISGFTCHNTVCESGLRGEIFEIDEFDNRYSYIKPDILYIDEDLGKVVFIEVKTLSESVERNIALYCDLEKYIGGYSLWECNLYYLLSHGHEKHHDWHILAEHGSKIIIWEDLFRVMAQSPIACLIGDNLSDYCEPPAQRG